MFPLFPLKGAFSLLWKHGFANARLFGELKKYLVFSNAYICRFRRHFSEAGIGSLGEAAARGTNHSPESHPEGTGSCWHAVIRHGLCFMLCTGWYGCRAAREPLRQIKSWLCHQLLTGRKSLKPRFTFFSIKQDTFIHLFLRGHL